MPNSTYKFAGTAADDAGVGTVIWEDSIGAGSLSSNRLSANDDNFAYTAWGSGAVSHWLKATNFGDTSADVPSGATIDGFEFRVQRYRDTTVAIASTAVKLVKGGAVSGNDFGAAGDWATSEETVNHGGASELGGLSWTDSEAIASDAGVAISITHGTGRLASAGALVDSIERRIYYTSAGGDAGITPWRRPVRRTDIDLLILLEEIR